MKHLISLILSVVLLTACGESERNNRLLQRAERVMENHPDSALAILCDSIDTTSLRTDRSRAIYALLLSQAYDKNYIDISSDSIIAPAVEYFADGNEPHYAMLTHYYHGKVLLNQNKLSDAIILCTKAENFAKELNDDFYLGLIYGTIGNAYHKTHNHSEDIKYSRLSYNHFSKINKQPHRKYAHFALAVAHNNNGDFDQSESIHKELIDSATISCDTAFLVEVLESYSHLLWNNNKKNESKTILSKLQNEYNYNLSARSLAHLADIYSIEEKEDSATHYLSLAKKNTNNNYDSVAIVVADYLLSYRQKNYEKAIFYLHKQINVLNKSTEELWRQSVMSRQRDHFAEQTKTKELEVKTRNIQLVIIVVIFVAVSMVLIIAISLFRVRAKAQKEKVERILSHLNYEKTIIEDAQKKITELEQLLENENAKSQNLINELAIQQEKLEIFTRQMKLKENVQNSITSSDIVIRFQWLLYNNQNPKIEDWNNLDSFINTHFSQFKSTLYGLTKLSELEYQVCLLTKCQFTPSEIAKLINRSKSSMPSIRTRLYNKLLKKLGSSLEFDQFILTLE